MRFKFEAFVCAILAACSGARPSAAKDAPAPPAGRATEVPLPGASGPTSLDYIIYERGNARVWVPAGGTGSVDVFDTAKGSFTRVQGFKTAERESHGNVRVVGPSAASVGDGVVYIGNRASSEVCPVDVKTLKVGSCLGLPSATDGVVYVAPSKEVWVTLPRERALAVLDASNPALLKEKAVFKVPGEPEGYAVDAAHGVFFTNLEDKGETLAIDIRTHQTTSTWHPGCGPEGPRGLAFDSARGFLVVACTDHVQVLNASKSGALLGKVDTGAGVDNIDYVPETSLLYVAAGKAARLNVLRVHDDGHLSVAATRETSAGVRNAVADAKGNAYVADSQRARLLVFEAGRHPRP